MISTDGIGAEIMTRLDDLKEISEAPGMLARHYLTDEHRRALDLVGIWMRDAGMSVRIDAVGNIIGRYEADVPGAPALVTGSHLDTVIDAGAYDGMLGVVLPVSYVGRLHGAGIRLPFAIEIIGFADEEGVRFKSTYLGSRAVAGCFDAGVLSQKDDAGIEMQDAMRTFGLDPAAIPGAALSPKDVLAFVEVHIEQGPVLEANDLPVGIVTGIAGAERYEITITGTAGHAGTVPMNMRADAAACTAEMILAVEARCTATPGLVGTVGRVAVAPGAVNVIPGQAVFSIDLRAGDNAVLEEASHDIRKALDDIAERRNVSVDVQLLHKEKSADADPAICKLLADAVAAEGFETLSLPSGAGHDAAVMAQIAPMGMLFVRCEGGISHNPAERICEDDATAAVRVFDRFVALFAEEHST